MQDNILSYRKAAVYALIISVVIHLLFVIMFLYAREAFMPPEVYERPRPRFNIYHTLYNFASTFLYSFIIYILNFKLLKLNMRRDIKLTLIILCTLVATLAISISLSHLQFNIFPFGRHPHGGVPYKAIRGALSRDFFISVIVVFSSQLTYLSYRKQQIALENEKLKAENVRTRYEVLKNQVDPHFLFNSLNTLSSIIDSDAVKAKEYLRQLSLVFRGALQNREVVSLDEEIKFTQAYCSLMSIRYGDSLQFEYLIEPALCHNKIISFGIQTLVENAIKHNIISNNQPLKITIRTDGDNVTVQNRIQPKKDQGHGEGIGLANLSERYRLKWKKEIICRSDNGMFSVSIPLIDESDNN